MCSVTQLCPTLCDPIDGSPHGSPVPGILQARTLEWVTISFSNAWTWKVKGKSLSRVWLSDPMDCSPPGSSVHGFSRQEYWSGVPLPSPMYCPLYSYYYCIVIHNEIIIQLIITVTHGYAFDMNLQAIDLLWSLCSQTSLLMIIWICSHSPALASLP